MPLSLSDDEYNAVQAAAAPIHPQQRGAFLQALAVELEGYSVIGPGVVHRCAAASQKTFVVAAHAETSRSAEPHHRGGPPGRALEAAGRSFAVCWSFGFVQCSPRSTTIGERNMTTVFIEARPKGRPEGSAIEDYVVEEQGDRVLKTFKTQEEAITWAKSEGHSPHVARVRHLNDKKIPDHWRPV
jgi:hypothetical protein